MNVLHATNWYFPESVGGIEVYVAELARRQRAAGMTPFVIAPEAGADRPRSYEWDGVEVLRYPMSAPARGFAEWLRHVRPDVVHVHSLSTGLGIDEVAAARSAAERVVFTAHLPALGFTCVRGTLLRWGVEPCDGSIDVRECSACMLQSRGLPRTAARAATFVGRALGPVSTAAPGRLGTGLRMSRIVAANRERQSQLLDDVDAFVALNRRTLDIVRRNGAPERKLALNLLGVGMVPRPKPSPDEQPTASPVHIAFVGRIHESKGLRVLLQALRAVPRDAALSVSICGPSDGQDSAGLVRLLRETAECDPRVRLRGALTREDVQNTLRAADVLCCPSTTWENGPTIALEAQAIGTPVIGSDVGAMPEFIRDGVNGRVLPPGQWKPLRDALAAIAREPHVVDGWRRRMPRARSMDDVARDYESIYARAPVMA